LATGKELGCIKFRQARGEPRRSIRKAKMLRLLGKWRYGEVIELRLTVWKERIGSI